MRQRTPKSTTVTTQYFTMEEFTNEATTVAYITRLGVRCTPNIQDPAELTTILLSSLRSLFGELESHSFGMDVKHPSAAQKQKFDFVVECHKSSACAIQASLTMMTTPSYLESTVFRFDTFSIEGDEE
mmetsp:Transcript_24393/g.39874  ORF Transcript_24393/g.39874 Transcript_24393/m.39874 type:complete len:128 (+) Transcript_24393:393-776(+)